MRMHDHTARVRHRSWSIVMDMQTCDPDQRNPMECMLGTTWWLRFNEQCLQPTKQIWRAEESARLAWRGSKRWYLKLWPRRVRSQRVGGSPCGCVHLFYPLCHVEEYMNTIHCCVVWTMWIMCLGNNDMHKMMRCRDCLILRAKGSLYPHHVRECVPKHLT